MLWLSWLSCSLIESLLVQPLERHEIVGASGPLEVVIDSKIYRGANGVSLEAVRGSPSACRQAHLAQ